MMEKFKSYFYLIFVLIFGLFLLACQPNAKNTENTTMNKQPYLLHFGPQGFKDFAQYNQGQVDNHPVASFRELDFSPPNLGQVKIENGASSLVVDHIFSVLGASFHKEEGIEVITINAGLNKEEFVSPEQAYQAYVDLMKQINQAGWKNYFYGNDPRISKEDNLQYLLDGHDIIDPSYIFSYEEWQKIISTSTTKMVGYCLYANGVLLNLSIKQTNKTENGMEQYIVRYAFDSIRYVYRNLMDDSENNINTYTMTPQELERRFKDKLVRDNKIREVQEKEAIAKGYRIDENYVAPDVWQYVK